MSWKTIIGHASVSYELKQYNPVQSYSSGRLLYLRKSKCFTRPVSKPKLVKELLVGYEVNLWNNFQRKLRMFLLPTSFYNKTRLS